MLRQSAQVRIGPVFRAGRRRRVKLRKMRSRPGGSSKQATRSSCSQRSYVCQACGSRDALEVTLEANPEDVTLDHATAWRRAGINRVSLGAQSFDDRVLKWMHRSHDASRIGDAVQTLRAAGFDNISLDLILRSRVSSSGTGARLGPCRRPVAGHLSLYGLTVEQRTPLARWISRGATAAADDERYAEEYLLAHMRLPAYGYHFYEVSNAARERRRSRHNSAYWSGRAYLGLGPAAHSFDGRVRRWNRSAWEGYRRAVSAGLAGGRGRGGSDRRAIGTGEPVPRVAHRCGRSSCALGRPLPPSAARWVEQGWADVVNQRLVCRPEGWLRLDGLIRDLTAVGRSS